MLEGEGDDAEGKVFTRAAYVPVHKGAPSCNIRYNLTVLVTTTPQSSSSPMPPL